MDIHWMHEQHDGVNKEIAEDKPKKNQNALLEALGKQFSELQKCAGHR